MHRTLALLLCTAALLAAFPAFPVHAGVDVNINLGVPAPPRVLFEREPEVLLVPRSRVYYVPTVSEYDMYRFGPYWYVNRDGYWYRARKYGGPFTVIGYRYVPREIIVVPATYHHHPLHPHGGPPGQLKKQDGHEHEGHGNEGHGNERHGHERHGHGHKH